MRGEDDIIHHPPHYTSTRVLGLTAVALYLSHTPPMLTVAGGWGAYDHIGNECVSGEAFEEVEVCLRTPALAMHVTINYIHPKSAYSWDDK